MFRVSTGECNEQPNSFEEKILIFLGHVCVVGNGAMGLEAHYSCRQAIIAPNVCVAETVVLCDLVVGSGNRGLQFFWKKSRVNIRKTKNV